MKKSTRKRHRRATDPPKDGFPREALDDPHRLAQVYLRERGRQSPSGWSLKYHRDDFYEWNGRRYRVKSETDLRAELTRAIKRDFDRAAAAIANDGKRTPINAKHLSGKPIQTARVTTSLVSNVLQALKGLVLIPASVEIPAWVGRSADRRPVVAMTNGVVDLEGLLAGEQDVLRQHSPDWFSTICLDYAYDANATCPEWRTFVDETLEHDQERIDLLQEMFGLGLTPDMSYQKFFVLIGEGANGKKAVTDVQTGVLGEENVSAVPLELFGERFQLTMTLGKLANIATEIGDIDRAAEGILKAFTSGDRMYFDRKNRPGIEARPTARLVFTTNNLPRFRDRSKGVLRRMVIVPFRVEVPIEKQDRLLTQKLLRERPGIFNWSIEGLRRLRANGRFTEPRVCREAMEEYWIEMNPARAFLKEVVRVRAGGCIDCGRLYGDYKFWCDANGYRPVNEREFGKEVRREFPSMRRAKPPGGRGAERPWAYFGIALANDLPAGLVAVPRAKSK